MVDLLYRDGCAGCLTSQGLRQTPGGIVTLPDNWTVNQYDNKEGFLGWLALQPRYHRMAFAELQDNELRSFGRNIKSIDRSLTQYWRYHFPRDPLKRVYIVYFFEQEFEKPTPKAPFHLHFHIIPRPKSFDTPTRLQRKEHGTKWVDGWRVPQLTPNKVVPEPYRRDIAEWSSNANKLIGYLRHELQSFR